MSENRYETAVVRYFEAWNATAAEDTAKAVADVWTEDGTYTDSLADVAGHTGIAAMITDVHEQFPGFLFRQTGQVEGHHDVARFTWNLVQPEDGAVAIAGFDVITLAEDGRIRTVIGFLDPAPAPQD